MDQNIRSSGGIITGALLMFSGFASLILGIGLLASYPDKLWPLGLVMLTCAILIFYGAIKAIRVAKTEKKQADAVSHELTKILSGVQQNAPSADSSAVVNTINEIQQSYPEILAIWDYSIQDWNAFMLHESGAQKKDILFVSILIFVVGTFFVYASTDATWPAAISVSLFVAAVYGLLKYNFHIKSIMHSGKENPKVIIMPQAIMINGHYNPLHGDNLWLEKAELKKEKQFCILEITNGWQTRSGDTNDELRVPVPAGKEAEAEQVVQKLLSLKKF